MNKYSSSSNLPHAIGLRLQVRLTAEMAWWRKMPNMTQRRTTKIATSVNITVGVHEYLSHVSPMSRALKFFIRPAPSGTGVEP